MMNTSALREDRSSAELNEGLLLMLIEFDSDPCKVWTGIIVKDVFF